MDYTERMLVIVECEDFYKKIVMTLENYVPKMAATSSAISIFTEILENILMAQC